MDSSRLQSLLGENIPLSRAMQITVAAASAASVTLAAPLAPNINHRETVFGGSASAVAMLAAWGLLQVRLAAESLPARAVIQRQEMDFEKPIAADFTATANWVDAAGLEKFLHMLRRKGRGRVAIAVELFAAGARVAGFRGEFVAIIEPAAPR
jgi:thioesterase domain-containing protein